MTVAAKREKLHNFVDSADDKQVKAIYSKIVDYINGKSDATDSLIKMKKMDITKQASNDPLFVADLKDISDDFANRS